MKTFLGSSENCSSIAATVKYSLWDYNFITNSRLLSKLYIPCIPYSLDISIKGLGDVEHIIVLSIVLEKKFDTS